MFRGILPVFTLTLGACAWTPAVMSYPSGLKIVRLDSHQLKEACGNGPIDGTTEPYYGEVGGCYDSAHDSIYVLNNNGGCRALTHELAHREGISDPSKDGYDW